VEKLSLEAKGLDELSNDSMRRAFDVLGEVIADDEQAGGNQQC
jgi:hypothetical protein